MSSEQSIIERLETLERQNRRLKRIGVAALVIAASVLLMGQASPPSRTVEAKEFVLRDSKGIVRSRWIAGGDGPYVEFLDANGKTRAILGATDSIQGSAGLDVMDLSGNRSRLDSDGLILLADNFKKQAHLVRSPNGEFNLRIANSNGEVSIAEAGVPSITVSDKEGFKASVGSTALVTPNSGETHQTSAASVVLFDKDKKVIWKTP